VLYPVAVFSIVVDLCDSPPLHINPCTRGACLLCRILLFSRSAMKRKNYYSAKLHAILNDSVFLCDERRCVLVLRGLSSKITYILQVQIMNEYNNSRPPLWSSGQSSWIQIRRPGFDSRHCHVISVTDPYGRILVFLDRCRYFFFQVAPQLYSRG
jgi:hypothetical protein